MILRCENRLHLGTSVTNFSENILVKQKFFFLEKKPTQNVGGDKKNCRTLADSRFRKKKLRKNFSSFIRKFYFGFLKLTCQIGRANLKKTKKKLSKKARIFFKSLLQFYFFLLSIYFINSIILTNLIPTILISIPRLRTRCPIGILGSSLLLKRLQLAFGLLKVRSGCCRITFGLLVPVSLQWICRLAFGLRCLSSRSSGLLKCCRTFGLLR